MRIKGLISKLCLLPGLAGTLVSSGCDVRERDIDGRLIHRTRFENNQNEIVSSENREFPSQPMPKFFKTRITSDRQCRDIAEEGGVVFWLEQLGKKNKLGNEISIDQFPKGCRLWICEMVLQVYTPELREFSVNSECPPDNLSFLRSGRSDEAVYFERLLRLGGEGYSPACLLLGRYYDIKEMDEKALYWYAKAIDIGCPEAMEALGLRHCNGNGVVLDFAEGAKWFLLAAAMGSVESRVEINKYLKMARRSEKFWTGFVEGQKRAIDWQQKHSELFMSP